MDTASGHERRRGEVVRVRRTGAVSSGDGAERQLRGTHQVELCQAGPDANARRKSGARLTGSVEIAVRPSPAISQQRGFTHAGAISAIADSAAGYAALTLAPIGVGVLTTEFKINFLAPAAGERIVARARIVKAGRTLTVAQSEVFAENGGHEKLIALLTATIMTIENRDGVSD